MILFLLLILKQIGYVRKQWCGSKMHEEENQLCCVVENGKEEGFATAELITGT